MTERWTEVAEWLLRECSAGPEFPTSAVPAVRGVIDTAAKRIAHLDAEVERWKERADDLAYELSELRRCGGGR